VVAYLQGVQLEYPSRQLQSNYPAMMSQPMAACSELRGWVEECSGAKAAEVGDDDSVSFLNELRSHFLVCIDITRESVDQYDHWCVC
jgi:hypothetical protein